jgi:hypothetical protein
VKCDVQGRTRYFQRSPHLHSLVLHCMLAAAFPHLQDFITLAEIGAIIQVSKISHLAVDHVQAYRTFRIQQLGQQEWHAWLAEAADPSDVFDWVRFEPTATDRLRYAREERQARRERWIADGSDDDPLAEHFGYNSDE